MSQSIIDHRGPKFSVLLEEVLEGLKEIFQTKQGRIVVYPGSGTASWEACIVNTLSPGDRILACVNGHFSALFHQTAKSFGIAADLLEVPYGIGIRAGSLEERLRADVNREVKAVLVVHNETSTGVTTDIAALRKVLDHLNHPALLLVDAVSSVGSIDFRFDEWRVDVALAGAQKGLMLPPGLAILAVGERALKAGKSARCPRSFWDWTPVLERNVLGEYPSTPATAHFFGLKESLAMLSEEGLPNVFQRHARLAEACRRAIRALGLELLAKNADEYSNTLSAVCMPAGFDSDNFVAHAYKRLDISLGIGLSKVKGKVFRIGHLGSLNELELLGALGGVEMALKSFGVPVPVGAGLTAAESYLLETAPAASRTR
jgi:alanine-glyoxylate transaminase/serine-glyoxylate transaminase/serine-pyruvate transaminase